MLVAQEAQQLRARVVLLDDGVADVRPVEAADEGARVLQLQPHHDVGARVRVGGGGERDARHAGKALVQHAQAQVLRAEIVPPLGDAMRLVDGEQAEQLPLVQRIQHRQEARRQDAFRRRIQQHQPARAQLALDRPTLPGCRACEFRKLACTPSFFERADLVVHQRDQRRHHDRHAVPGAVAGDRRHLVTQALAAAGGHQHQRVAAADHMLDDRLPARRGRPGSRRPRAGWTADRQAMAFTAGLVEAERPRIVASIPSRASGRPHNMCHRSFSGEHTMASVNKVIVVGNLGKDPEMRYMPGGAAICNITVATTAAGRTRPAATSRRNRVAPHRLLRPDGGDRRRVPEKGPAGLRRRPAEDAQVDRQGRRGQVHHRDRRHRHANARQPRRHGRRRGSGGGYSRPAAGETARRRAPPRLRASPPRSRAPASTTWTTTFRSESFYGRALLRSGCMSCGCTALARLPQALRM